MGAAKKDAKSPSKPLRAAMVFAIRRQSAIAACLLLAGLTYGGWQLWDVLKKDVLSRPEYALAPHQIHITTPPPWIKADVKTESLRDGSLEGTLTVMDDKLPDRLARAFALHPWVARVESVAKHYPGRVVVELIYRRPVAMVAVAGGLFAVDEDGVLLPSGDFSTAEAHQYPRIDGIQSRPLGPVGSPWGDRAVVDAVKIAMVLQDTWRESQLYSIRRARGAADATVSGPAEYELVMRSGTEIPWGHAPGSEAAGEPSVAEKLMRLKRAAAEQSVDADRRQIAN